MVVSEQFYKKFADGEVGVLCNDESEKYDVCAWAQRCGIKLGPSADMLLKYGETNMGYPIVRFDTELGYVTAVRAESAIARVPYSDFDEAYDCDDIDDSFDYMLFGIMNI